MVPQIAGLHQFDSSRAQVALRRQQRRVLWQVQRQFQRCTCQVLLQHQRIGGVDLRSGAVAASCGVKSGFNPKT